MNKAPRQKIPAFIGLVLVVILGIIFIFSQKISQPEKPQNLPKSDEQESITIEESQIVFPIAEFEEKITKKPFGIYITPQNSPIQPERFTGYHTGVDVEYEETTAEVPVFAIADGEIVLARWVPGYGGVIILKSNFENQDLYIFYGHLSQQSFIKNVQVKKGEQIAVLGKGQTQETDFERKHLHFGIIKNRIDLRGYVETEEELDGWFDPLEFYKGLI